MQVAAKETVIIVHGTWAAPEPGNARWYQPIDGVPAAHHGRLDSATRLKCRVPCGWGPPTEAALLKNNGPSARRSR
jgi:hypothetical protein